jgi:dTDP-4-amino-4,6-dideoxygalactose transaminase
MKMKNRNAKIPFNLPHMTGKELEYISRAHKNGVLAGNGPFTNVCEKWLTEKIGCRVALLTHSCTAALEMAALLIDIKPGDEIIMPSYTFVSTANAFVLRGGIPVFVDIRSDTLNIDETLIEAAITPMTKAIVPVHYAGVPCEMDAIMEIAKKYELFVIEDAAQALLSSYKGKPLGSIGDLGCLSFHETKNVISGEGGALLVNNKDMIMRAEIVREKGTNRSKFFRGEIDKYTWIDIGSSYLPGEIIGAFLWAQLEQAESITERRLDIWNYYHKSLEPLETLGRIRRPIMPYNLSHNAHMYFIILRDNEDRNEFIEHMKSENIHCLFHYVPLHTSPAGIGYCRTHGKLEITNKISESLVRLPLWLGIDKKLPLVTKQINSYFEI